MEKPTTIDPQMIFNALVGLSKGETVTRTPHKQRTKQKQTSKNEKTFLDALIDFRRHGYQATWSMNGSWVVLEFYGVERSFNGFKAAAKALMDRIEQWKTSK